MTFMLLFYIIIIIVLFWKVTEEEVPGYSELVSKPMYFELIEKNIKNKVYFTLAEFASDIELMCENCLNTNAQFSLIYEVRLRLTTVAFHHLCFYFPVSTE